MQVYASRSGKNSNDMTANGAVVETHNCVSRRTFRICKVDLHAEDAIMRLYVGNINMRLIIKNLKLLHYTDLSNYELNTTNRNSLRLPRCARNQMRPDTIYPI